MKSRKKSSLTKFHYLDYFWERKLVKIVQGQTRWIVHIPSKCTLNSAYLMIQWKFSQHMLTVRSISTRSSPMSQHRSPVLSMRLVFSAIIHGQKWFVHANSNFNLKDKKIVPFQLQHTENPMNLLGQSKCEKFSPSKNHSNPYSRSVPPFPHLYQFQINHYS